MTDVLGHYDIRYFKGVVDYDVRTDTLHHLMRSYLLFFQEKGLETWIAHGTLLGWWWNGQVNSIPISTSKHSPLTGSSPDITMGLGHRYSSLR